MSRATIIFDEDYMRRAFERYHPCPDGVYWDDQYNGYLHDSKPASVTSWVGYVNKWAGWRSCKMTQIIDAVGPDGQMIKAIIK